MVNIHDPALVRTEEWGMVTLSHIFYGLFLWEFFSTLDYEWNVFRGHIPYRWTIWVYSLTRIAGLMSVIFHMIDLDLVTPINCQVEISFLVSSCFLALAAASLLIVLRIIAIWNGNKVAVVMAVSVWGINVVFLTEGAARLRSKWVPKLLMCMADTNPTIVPALISMAVTDIVLLLTMLVGLLRLRSNSGGTSGLAQLLWKQGLLWFLLASVAEVPPGVLLAMKTNNEFEAMFQLPAVLIMAIAATRMHRSLVHFAHGPPDAMHTFQISKLKFASKKTPHTTTISINPIETTAHTISERHPTPLTGDHDLSINADEGVREKPTRSGWGLDNDVESGQTTH